MAGHLVILVLGGLSVLRYMLHEVGHARLRLLGGVALILLITSRFFSRSMEHLPIAQAFFSQHLPQHIGQLLDLDSFVRPDRTNTNQKLEQRRRDIAYEGQMEGEIALLACAEHQSQPDIMMPVRLLHYGADGMTPYLKEHKKISLLIQMLFYNGEPSPYPYPNTLQAYYGHPEWGSQELALRFYLIDATQISDEAFLKHGHCAPMALLVRRESRVNNCSA